MAEIIKDQPIQWHLANSEHDKCFSCGSLIHYVNQTYRYCRSCGKSYHLKVTPAKWLSLASGRLQEEDKEAILQTIVQSNKTDSIINETCNLKHVLMIMGNELLSTQTLEDLKPLRDFQVWLNNNEEARDVLGTFGVDWPVVESHSQQ